MSSRRDHLAGVPVELIEVVPEAAGTLLYLHGGGYALGSAAGYRGVVGRLAAAAGMDAVVPEYSRSPEAVFPTALEEVVGLYGALLERPGPVVVAGDSAGGGLTLAFAMKVRDDGLPAPAALGLICPWLDLVADRDGTRPARRDPLIVPEMLRGWVGAYAGTADPAQPYISPVFGDLSGLPPIVLHSAGDDPIAADSEMLEASIAALDGSTHLEHRAWQERWHCFHLQAGLFRDADRAVLDMGTRLAALAGTTRPSDRGHRS